MSRIDLVFPLLAVCVLLTILGEGRYCRDQQGALTKVPAEGNDRLAKGVWGGEHIRLEVTDTGADVEYDCAHGTIDEPVILDSAGNFDVKGRYTPQHAGPIRGDEQGNSSSVRYVGHARDTELTLTITIPEKKETIGNFTLTHRSDGRLMKCR